MAMFHLLKIRTSIDIFKNKKCKVTFGLEYIMRERERERERERARATLFQTFFKGP